MTTSVSIISLEYVRHPPERRDADNTLPKDWMVTVGPGSHKLGTTIWMNLHDDATSVSIGASVSG